MAIGTLAHYLKLVDWTPEQLARKINVRCGPGTISRKAPYGWINGSCPRGKIPDVVAALLSEHLGDRITAADIWPDRISVHTPVCDIEEHNPWTHEGFMRFLSLASGVGSDEPCVPRTPLGSVIDWIAEVTSTSGSHAEEVPDTLLELTTRVRSLCHSETIGAVARPEWYQQELACLCRLYQSTAHDRHHTEPLLDLIAQVAHQCARLASHAENHSLGQYYLLGALRASLKSGNHEFGVRIVADIVDYLTNAGYAYDAIRILKILESTRIANRLSQSPLAITDLLIGRKASALAALGLHDDFEEIVVERCHDASETSGAAMPSWYCPSLITCELGYGWLSLRDYSRACSYLHRGLAGLGASDPSTTFYKLSLVQAALQLGDTDTGIYHLRECLQLPNLTSTKRNQKKVSEIHKWVVGNRDAVLSSNVPDLDKLILQTA